MKTKTIMNITILAALSGALLLSSGCAPSMKTLNTYVTSQGFIPYVDPVQNAGPGTVIGGSPAAVTFVAPPQTCFPDVGPSGASTNLRDTFPASLPSEASNITATGSLSVQLTNLVTSLTTVNLSASAGFSDITEVDLQVGSAEIDSLNLVALQSYYENGMSADCKDYLNVTGFVLEGLKVNQLTFQFKNSSGATVNLTGAFASSVSAGVSGSYQVVNSTSLVITSPTYIGYQLGSLRNGSGGFTLYRAADVVSGQYDFKSLTLFPGSPADTATTTAAVSSIPTITAHARFAN